MEKEIFRRQTSLGKKGRNYDNGKELKQNRERKIIFEMEN